MCTIDYNTPYKLRDWIDIDKINWDDTNVTCNNQGDRPPWPSEEEYTTDHTSDFCDNCQFPPTKVCFSAHK